MANGESYTFQCDSLQKDLLNAVMGVIKLCFMTAAV